MRPRNLIAFLIGLVGGLACLALGTFGLYRDWQFSGQAERVPGTIDRLDSTDGRSAAHMVIFHFSDKNGVSHQARTPVRRRTWRSLHAGDAVTVIYVPGHPELSRINAPGEATWWWENSSIGVFCGLLVLGLAFFLVRPR